MLAICIHLSGLVIVQAGDSENMLSRCANSECCKPFLRLREGKLFLIETDRITGRRESVIPRFVRTRRMKRCVEHYWLCDECAAQWTLVYDKDRGIGVASLRRPPIGAAAISAVSAHSA
jgi:hypothetical protein